MDINKLNKIVDAQTEANNGKSKLLGFIIPLFVFEVEVVLAPSNERKYIGK